MIPQGPLLITGASGFLGSFFAHRLLRAGASPWLLARSAAGESARARVLAALAVWEDGLGAKIDPERVRVIDGDVTRPELGISPRLLCTMTPIAHIVHAAADISFQPADRESVWRVNVEGTRHAAALASRLGATLHHISTAYVCGEAQGSIRETLHRNATGFRNAYEESKHRAEEEVARAVASGELRALIYRPSVVLGESRSGVTCCFSTLYRWIELLDQLATRARSSRGVTAADGDEPVDLDLVFPADPDAWLSLVPADYVVDATLALAARSEPDGRIFHLVSHRIPSNQEHHERIGSELGVEGVVLRDPDPRFVSELTPRQRKFVEALRMYADYPSLRLDFDDSNTRMALAGTGIEAPEITPEYTRTIIRYARARGYGRRRRAKPSPPSPARARAEGFFLDHLPGFVGRRLIPDLERLDTVFSVLLDGTETSGAAYTVFVEGARIQRVQPGLDPASRCRFRAAPEIFLEIVGARLDAREAFFAGKTEIEGDLESGLSLVPVISQFFAEHPYDPAHP